MLSPRSARVLRAVGVLALAVAVSVAAVFLGRWQYHRHETKAAAIEAFNAGQAAEPAPLVELIPPGASAVPPASEWRTATVAGAFASAEPTWLRNRPVDSQPAVHALGWFVTDDGRSYLVDAGWVDALASARPTLPTDHLTLTVTIRVQEDDDGRRDAGATRIVATQMPPAPTAEVPGYGMVSQACLDPCGSIPGLTPTPLPQLGLGPHLSYAWQWWFLAAAAPVIGVTVVVRESRGATGEGAPNGNERPPAETRPARRRRGLTDEEIEDAL